MTFAPNHSNVAPGWPAGAAPALCIRRRDGWAATVFLMQNAVRVRGASGCLQNAPQMLGAPSRDEGRCRLRELTKRAKTSCRDAGRRRPSIAYSSN
jgi:hypothetical protein